MSIDRVTNYGVVLAIAMSSAWTCRGGMLEAVMGQNGTLVPLGIGATSSIGFGINDAGMIVGEADTSIQQGFLWQNGTVTYLAGSPAPAASTIWAKSWV